jgi:hypothetical protein
VRRAALAVSCLLLAACGSVSSSSPSTGYAFDQRNLITYEEIKAAKTPGWSAWDLIAQTRPNFLRTRGATSLRDPTPVRAVIYLDGVLYGKLETLRNLNIEEIREIEFISAGDATTRFGTDHLGGAILIRTR